jgi:CRP/FNR family cyclic AMP-dependent transcriptional regulator
MDRVAILKHVAWFADLEVSELELVASKSDNRLYPKGSVVFHEGDAGDYLLVIVAGRLRVTLFDRDGQETIIKDFGQFECLGEVSLLDGAPRSATVLAIERTEVLRIGRAPFLALLKSHPAIMLKVVTRLAAVLRRATEQIRTLTMQDREGRVVCCLMMIALDRGLPSKSQLELRPRPTDSAVARMIGFSRETVSRAMNELRRGGYITDVEGGLIVERRAIRRYWQPPDDRDAQLPS